MRCVTLNKLTAKVDTYLCSNNLFRLTSTERDF